MKNEKLKIKNLFILVLLSFLFSGMVVNARECSPSECPHGEFIPECCPTQGLVPCGTTCCPCQLCHLFVLIDNIIGYVFTYIIPPVALLVIFWGGYYLLFSRGDPELVRKGKMIIMGAVIGLGVIFFALIFIYSFLDAIGVAEWTGLKSWKLGDWWEIECP